ncbi:MAG: hypothetical protein BWY99_02775 [Synergistetes bacterium ADurb.BinA166]|nr:MAG: hypothetical protein BWY99_02775 [Synergistetes bacterium ADurb.BinA166]
MLDRFAKVCRRGLEDFLEVVGERDVVEEEDGPGPEVVVVVERFVGDCALEFVGRRDEVLHRCAGMGFALPGVAGDGDMKAVRVLDRLRGKGHRETLRDGPVADVPGVEGVEEEGERVTVAEDLDSSFIVFVDGRRGWWLLLHGCLLWSAGSLLLMHPPEFGPALGAAAAACVVAAGKDGAVYELDGKRAVFVG